MKSQGVWNFRTSLIELFVSEIFQVVPDSFKKEIRRPSPISWILQTFIVFFFLVGFLGSYSLHPSTETSKILLGFFFYMRFLIEQEALLITTLVRAVPFVKKSNPSTALYNDERLNIKYSIRWSGIDFCPVPIEIHLWEKPLLDDCRLGKTTEFGEAFLSTITASDKIDLRGTLLFGGIKLKWRALFNGSS